MKNISSNKNVRKEKSTTPQKDPKKGKEVRTTPLKASIVGKRKQIRKSNEDQNNNSESIMEEVGETPSISSQEKIKVQKKKIERLLPLLKLLRYQKMTRMKIKRAFNKTK